MKTKEEWREYHKAWRKKNRDKVSAANKAFYDRNAEAMRVRSIKYSVENPDKRKAQAVARMERYRNDPEFHAKVLEWGKESRGRRKEYIAEYEKKRQRENPGKYKAIRANNLMQRAHRTPAWADIEKINFFYECCPAGCEIDHIIPLRGEHISGLHVETNLQWLTREQNRIKSNSWIEP